MPYMLIDCSGIEGGAAKIPRQIFSELQCLFAGTLAVELADVGPYLGRLKNFSTEVARTVEELLARQVGLLIVVENDPIFGMPDGFFQLYRHFRKFNTVVGPNGKQLFFRYCDPRVIVDVLKALDSQQIEAFYGPVTEIVLTDKNKRTIRVSKTWIGQC